MGRQVPATVENALRLGRVSHRSSRDEQVDAARLIDQVVDYAIISLDRGGHIVSWNAGAQRLKGYAADDALGRHFSIFYLPEDRAAGLPDVLLGRAREQGSVQHSGWRLRSDGTRFWGDVVITSLHDEDQQHVGFVKVTRDLTLEHQMAESLRRSEQRFRLLVEQVVDCAIIALDPHGRIETWNSGAERLKGYGAGEAIGRHFAMFYPEADQEAGLPQHLLDEARRHGSVEHTGWRVRSDGSRFWGDVIITALHDDRARLIGFAKVTRDLTSRKRLEDARETFLDTFAHDFRAPVTAIAGFAELLAEAGPDERDHLVERIRINASRLVDMTTVLVEHSRVRTGTAPLALERLRMDDVVRLTLAGLSGSEDTSRIVVEVGPLSVLGDLSALERVLVNLLTNALHYSAADTVVRIVASTERERVVLRVVDRGRGIDPDDLATIFDEFERGRLAADDGGSGLGLTSVKLLVAQMQGTVDIDSEPGAGTTVALSFASA